VFLSAARVLPTILIDGFVAGTWTTARENDHATLTVAPFRPITKTDRDALAEQGERLLRFIYADAETVAVNFV
jgi:hypothetical protein